MFLTGEFSKIARVSKRSLQYYDEIGLLKPAYTDAQSGYRYYSARQLPRLNRILALKELGLTLQQIARMLEDDISEDEIRGMLLMQKSQLEQSLMQDLQRFRRIELLLQHPTEQAPDVVLKSVPAQRFLSMRTHISSLQTGWELILYMVRTLAQFAETRSINHFIAITHAETLTDDDIDVEFGFVLEENIDSPITISEDYDLTLNELPAVPTMATLVHLGGPATTNLAYGALGMWLEANNYGFTGPQREVFIEFPFPANDEDIVIEIQFPVKPMHNHDLLLSALPD
jgi:DNA-binding transcriptional MerR regulator